MNQSATSHYTFGDTDLAALRLERLAAAYAPSTTTFLRSAVPQNVNCVVDLGSGLGLTTKLLAEATLPSRAIGYERSAKHLERARVSFPQLEFREVDVLRAPYPDRDLDVVYSRFLLTHLHDPHYVIAACVEHLRPTGRLLLEETSVLSSTIPALQKYYFMVGEMQAHYGQELCIGLRLEALARTLVGCKVTANQTPIVLTAQTMARLHAMNISTWKHDPFMLKRHGTLALDGLEAQLNTIAASGQPLPAVSCVMAQVVVERT